MINVPPAPRSRFQTSYYDDEARDMVMVHESVLCMEAGLPGDTTTRQKGDRFCAKTDEHGCFAKEGSRMPGLTGPDGRVNNQAGRKVRGEAMRGMSESGRVDG